MPYKASAPGSLMLLGEYAVLYGKPSLVCAIDKRITVTLTPRADDRIEIQSSLHGHHSTVLSNLALVKPFHFVLGAIKEYQAKLRRGFDLHIESEFSDKVGFGSSAAVTVATIATIVTWLRITISPIQLLRQGRNVIRHIQGIGSGADVAGSVYGGIVAYQAQPLIAEKFSITHPLTAVYAGFKTPTAEAIKRVQDAFATRTDLFRLLTNSIGQCAIDGIQMLRRGDWKGFGDIMNIQQGLMESLGVSTPLMHEMIENLRKESGIQGAKISGAGLGDCVIGLGPGHSGMTEGNIPIEMSLQGVTCEKI